MTKKGRHLNSSLVTLVSLMASSAFSQGITPTQSRSQTTTCNNIVAITGNINLNCANLSPEQSKAIEQIPVLLRRILANQNPPAIMAKIDAILQAVSQREGYVSAPNGIVISGHANVENPTVNNFGPRIRRLPSDFISSASACLALHPGTVNISALSGDGEAYQYAEDWFTVFNDAQWTITDKTVHTFIPANGDFAGTTLSVRGSGTTYDSKSPGGAAVDCLLGKRLPESDKGNIILYPDAAADYVTVMVGHIPIVQQ